MYEHCNLTIIHSKFDSTPINVFNLEFMQKLYVYPADNFYTMSSIMICKGLIFVA